MIYLKILKESSFLIYPSVWRLYLILRRLLIDSFWLEISGYIRSISFIHSFIYLSNIYILVALCSKYCPAAAESLQSCPTLCDPIDGSPPGSPIPGILQARTLEWVAISFSNAWKSKVKVKSLSHVWLLVTPWTQPTRLLHPWDFPGKSTGVG